MHGQLDLQLPESPKRELPPAAPLLPHHDFPYPRFLRRYRDKAGFFVPPIQLSHQRHK